MEGQHRSLAPGISHLESLYRVGGGPRALYNNNESGFGGVLGHSYAGRSL